ncbi:MAG: histidinol-phosphate aminotransferase [Alteromonadaceae bacterium]|jgi:histidinol-phosphate aminotransferase|tara:strand:- start:2534 stop:3646 length:1113 start_codon:yes stop_codon:yes gene_type:complete
MPTNSKNSPSITNKLAREELINMVPYQSARRLFSSGDDATNKIWLNANEASGPGTYQLEGNSLNRYPDFQPESLLKAYSNYAQQPVANILATRGADEGIELLIRTFCKAYQDNIVICPPTYGMYAISAESHGAGIVKVPLINNELDLEGLKANVGKVKIVFLCSPGNPTGNLLPAAQIKETIELFKDSAIVVVDEAYIEFSAKHSVASWLQQYENLVILRTLSKAFALAGLRCGFTLANSDIINMLSKVIAPYPISAPVAEIGSIALANDNLKQVSIRVKETDFFRQQLITWLALQPWCEKVHHSDANFVLFKAGSEDLKDFIFNALLARGILIRDQSKQPQLMNCLRISIGSEHELKLLIETITLAFDK